MTDGPAPEQHGAGRITGLSHAGVTVSDLDRSLAFYRDVLGLEVAHRGVADGAHAWRIWGLEADRVEVAFLRIPGTRSLVELFEFRGIERRPAAARPCDPGSGHLCLFVDDVDALHARVLAAGHRSRSGEVVAIPEAPHAGARVAYLLDPDGYSVEIYQRAPAG